MGHYPHISLARKTSLGLELFVRWKFHFIRISEISDTCFVWEEKKEKVKITTPKIIFHNRKFRGKKRGKERPRKHWFTAALTPQPTFVSRRISRSPFDIMSSIKEENHSGSEICVFHGTDIQELNVYSVYNGRITQGFLLIPLRYSINQDMLKTGTRLTIAVNCVCFVFF